MRAPPRGFSQLAASFIALRLHRHPPQTYISLDHIVLPSGTSAHRPSAPLCQAPRARDSQPVPYPPYPLLCQRTITIDHPSPLHFVERDRVELSTPALSERCSNQLSYHSKIYEERRGEGEESRHCMPTARTQPGAHTAPDFPFSQKGGDPAAPSGTTTLLRLHPPHRAYLGKRPPRG